MNKKVYIHLALAGALLFVSVGVYGFLYTKVQQQSLLANTLAGELQAKGLSSTQSLSAKNALEEIAKNEVLVQTYFVSSADIVPFLGSLQERGRSLGTKVEVVSVSADTAKPYGHLNLALKIQGSFANVLRTLGALEYQPYDTTLKSLALDSQAPGEWTGTITMMVGTIPVASTTKPRIETVVEKTL
jgi:hypothetical protein